MFIFIFHVYVYVYVYVYIHVYIYIYTHVFALTGNGHLGSSRQPRLCPKASSLPAPPCASAGGSASRCWTPRPNRGGNSRFQALVCVYTYIYIYVI